MLQAFLDMMARSRPGYVPEWVFTFFLLFSSFIDEEIKYLRLMLNRPGAHAKVYPHRIGKSENSYYTLSSYLSESPPSLRVGFAKVSPRDSNKKLKYAAAL